MSNADKILRGGVTLFTSQIAIQFLSLLRNIIIARLLFPEDFGIASTFAVTTVALELISDFSLGKAIVRDKDGDDPAYQSTIVTLSLIRGLILAAVLFFSAGWIADIFEIPEAKFAYQILAVSPVIRSFIHMDMYRVQRKMDFSVEIIANLASQVVGLIVAVVLAWITRDYIAILWSVIFQTAALVIASHIKAERKYAIGIEKRHMYSAIGFGWPIMINGIVLMLATQADRFLVGAQLGMLELAQYTVVMMLVTMPSGMLSRVVASLTLPLLSEVQEDHPRFQNRYDLVGHVTSVMAVGCFVPLILLGSDVIRVVFGEAYFSTWLLVGWASIAAAVRFLRTRMVNTFLAFGNTRDLMYSESVRASGIILAYFALVWGGGLLSVGLALAAGEGIALALCIFQLRRGKPFSIQTGVTSYAAAIATMALAIALLTRFPTDVGVKLALSCVIPIVYTAISMVFVPKLREYALSLLRQAQGILPSRSR